MEALKSFLERYRVKPGESCTHTSKSTGELKEGWISGSYYVGKDVLDQFFVKYCNAVSSKNKGPLTLTEKPTVFAPLRVDFDFKATIETGMKRQYTIKMIKRIVSIYQDEIAAIVDPAIYEKKLLWCLVLEKPSPRVEDGVIKDGFHLHFPYFIVDKWVSDVYLRAKVTTRMIAEDVWKDAKLITKPQDIIDTSMAAKPWMMYGSCNYKNKNSLPYVINRKDGSEKHGHAFDHNQKEIELDKMFEEKMEARRALSEKTLSVNYYLPRFLSVRGYTQDTNLKQDITKMKAQQSRRTGRTVPINRRRDIEDILKDIQTIKEAGLMGMLNDDRADKYESWMDVGWTLFSITQGHEEGLEMWIDFARRSPKFVEGECEDQWNRMIVRDKTIGSLLRMAHNDSPIEYGKYKEHDSRNKAWQALEESRPAEYDTAEIVKSMFGDKYVCARAGSGESSVWYKFLDHRWDLIEDGLPLRKLLVVDIRKIFVDLEREINTKCGSTKHRIDTIDEEYSEEKVRLQLELKKLELQKRRCAAYSYALKTDTFMSKVIRACRIWAHNPQFERKLDENRTLLGFENGVLDLELCTFREGRPDDYVSMSTRINYQHYNPEDDEMIEVEDYFMKVYPNPARREFAKNFFALTLKGGNDQKAFLIATGDSDGGKTMTFKLIRAGFGDYYDVIPRYMLTQSTNSNNSAQARPDLLEFKGKRFITGTEFKGADKFNMSTIKEFTGDETQKARGMHSGKFHHINIQAVFAIGCNDRPKVDADDEAFFSRVHVLDHEAKFILPKNESKYTIPATLEEQMAKKIFPADINLKERLPHMAPAMMCMLFERYKAIKGKIPPIPDEVKMSSQRYRQENDVFSNFTHQRIVRAKEEDAKGAYILMSIMRNDFDNWCKQTYTAGVVNKDEYTLKKKLISILGEIQEKDKDKELYGYRNGRWFGYTLRKEDGEDEEEIVVRVKDTDNDKDSKKSKKNVFGK